MLGYTRGKTRGGRVGGFPEPERAVRGAPEALRVLRGKSCRREKTNRRGRDYRRRRDCRRGRELDYSDNLYEDCDVNRYVGMNDSAQDVL